MFPLPLAILTLTDLSLVKLAQAAVVSRDRVDSISLAITEYFLHTLKCIILKRMVGIYGYQLSCRELNEKIDTSLISIC